MIWYMLLICQHSLLWHDKQIDIGNVRLYLDVDYPDVRSEDKGRAASLAVDADGVTIRDDRSQPTWETGDIQQFLASNSQKNGNPRYLRLVFRDPERNTFRALNFVLEALPTKKVDHTIIIYIDMIPVASKQTRLTAFLHTFKMPTTGPSRMLLHPARTPQSTLPGLTLRP
jgi:hypothetical protein